MKTIAKRPTPAQGLLQDLLGVCDVETIKQGTRLNGRQLWQITEGHNVNIKVFERLFYMWCWLFEGPSNSSQINNYAHKSGV